MRNRNFVNPNSLGKPHLTLVGNTELAWLSSPLSHTGQQEPDLTMIQFLTIALMNRLFIPKSNSIVGLLNVGGTSNNYDELFKWILKQCREDYFITQELKIQFLEKKFKKTVAQFPED